MMSPPPRRDVCLPSRSRRAAARACALLLLGLGLGCGAPAVQQCVAATAGTQCVKVDFGPFSKFQQPCGPRNGNATCPQGQTCYLNDAFPQGACSTTCDPAQLGACGYGASCEPLPGGAAYCMKSCASQGDCPSGNTCAALPSHPTGQTLCIPSAAAPSAPRSCPAPTLALGGTVGPVTAPPTGSCAEPVGASALGGGQVIHIPGAQRVGTVIPITVPQGTASLTIISQAIDAGTSVFIPGPDGGPFALPNSVIPSPMAGPSVYFNDLDAGPNPPAPTAASLFFGGLSNVAGAVTFPNTSAALDLVAASGGVPAGSWTFGVNDYAQECAQGAGCTGGGSTNDTYDITVILKSGPPAQTGTLDLGIYIMSAALPDAGVMSADPNMTRMLQRIQGMYGEAGICLGTVTFYDVQPWAQGLYSTVNADNSLDPCSPIHQMFTLSQPTNALNLFFVDAITATGEPVGLSILGIDGTIPGPASVGGTVQSGAVVTASSLDQASGCGTAFDPFGCGPDSVAYISAHEGGHFMGLYHTTEEFGDSFDPLLDSPVCDCATCLADAGSCATNNPSGTPTSVGLGSECSTQLAYCGGGQDLMFWLLTPGSVGHLTPEQAQVARGNPVVH